MNDVLSCYTNVKRESVKDRFTNSNLESIRLFNNFAKSHAIELYVQKYLPIKILDFACGKGSDYFKFKHHYTIEKYVGIDITQKSLDDFQERLGNNTTGVHLYQYDLRNTFETNELYSVVNIGFAFHYFFETEEIINNFFTTLRNVLLPNGRVIITTPNKNEIESRLLKTRYVYPNKKEIRIHSESNNDLLCRITKLNNSNNSYFFELYDNKTDYAVRAEEYYVDNLENLCKKYGFEKVNQTSLYQFVKNSRHNSLGEHMGVKNLNFTRSDESILSLYDVIILEKCGTISKDVINNTLNNNELNVFDDMDDFFGSGITTTNQTNPQPPPSPPYSSTDAMEDFDF